MPKRVCVHVFEYRDGKTRVREVFQAESIKEAERRLGAPLQKMRVPRDYGCEIYATPLSVYRRKGFWAKAHTGDRCPPGWEVSE